MKVQVTYLACLILSGTAYFRMLDIHDNIVEADQPLSSTPYSYPSSIEKNKNITETLSSESSG